MGTMPWALLLSQITHGRYQFMNALDSKLYKRLSFEEMNLFIMMTAVCWWNVKLLHNEMFGPQKPICKVSPIRGFAFISRPFTSITANHQVRKMQRPGWKNRSTAKRKQSRTGNHIFKIGQSSKIIICGSGAPFMEAIIFLYGLSLRSTLAIIIWLILKPFEKEGETKPFWARP